MRAKAYDHSNQSLQGKDVLTKKLCWEVGGRGVVPISPLIPWASHSVLCDVIAKTCPSGQDLILNVPLDRFPQSFGSSLLL